MSDRNRTAAFCTLLSFAFVSFAAVVPSHGPAKGYLIITGGDEDYKRFIELAGGPTAHIVVVPTASIASRVAEAMIPPYCSAPGPFAGIHCTVLHTTDRKVADSPEFVAPLKHATGVWLEGGRHWRLADAYLDTLVLKELFNVLARGGVIGGGSGGATIQGSYMVRGSSDPDDNTIMMAPGHETGFGFFTNVTIDQHVDTRHRENDLAPVMKAHPDLLGLGLDQSTSITMHRDTLIVNGPGRVAVWDGKDHEGKGYYYLRAGDTLNTATRVATMAAHPHETTLKQITLPNEILVQYVGTYQMGQRALMTITLEGDQIISQFTGQGKVPIVAESGGKFFLKTVELEFTKGPDGKVTQLILHQSGADLPMKRLGDSEARQASQEFAARATHVAQRFRDQKPFPGSEEALRSHIEGLRSGEPNYGQMSSEFAQVTRQQLAWLKEMVHKLGVPQSVTFKGVGPGGADIYELKFPMGSTQWRIMMTTDSKIENVAFLAM